MFNDLQLFFCRILSETTHPEDLISATNTFSLSVKSGLHKFVVDLLLSLKIACKIGFKFDWNVSLKTICNTTLTLFKFYLGSGINLLYSQWRKFHHVRSWYVLFYQHSRHIRLRFLILYGTSFFPAHIEMLMDEEKLHKRLFLCWCITIAFFNTKRNIITPDIYL